MPLVALINEPLIYKFQFGIIRKISRKFLRFFEKLVYIAQGIPKTV